jgi:glycogen debranching enzyme
MMRQDLTTVAGHAFVVTDALGDIAPGSAQGLFAADTRFLSRYQLRLAGTAPLLLRSASVGHTEAHVYATNVALAGIPDQTLELVRRRNVGEVFVETIAVTNRGHDPVAIELTLAVDADFADIFEVRALLSARPPRRAVGRAERTQVVFRDRQRSHERLARVRFSPVPAVLRRGVARFPVHLEPGAAWTLEVRLEWAVPRATTALPIPIPLAPQEEPLTAWLRHVPTLESDDRDLQLAYDRAIHDLALLELALSSGHAIPAAGVPWYLAIFGRDALITSLQTLILSPRLAAGTLRTLAAYQARRHSNFRDAEPGKMPHEVRFGTLAETGEVPHARYYGTVDATPLWLILLVEAFRWSDDRDLVAELMPAAERALRWIDEHGDLDGDGLIEYQCRSRRGLVNQGWKDSWDSIRFADGRFAESPIALVEVQGYTYAAKQAMAELYDRLGRMAEADRLRIEAARLKRLVQEAFWLPEEGYYALALDAHKRPVDSITSNPGHLLWSGLPDESYARQVVARLMAPDSFTGWGIRTMASTMRAYNPLSYHNGSVWPHDTALLVAGFRRYGCLSETATVADGLIAATDWFDGHRLPELFCGYDRATTPFPVDYPVACSPQAWAAGSIVLLLQSLAGIAPESDQLVVSPVSHGRTLRLSGVPWRGAQHDVVADASQAAVANRVT